MPRLRSALVLATLLALVLPFDAGPVHAAESTTAAPAPSSALALADDDALYRCKKFADNAKIRVTLKPETTLSDLVAWAMGFSCKSFLYGTGVGKHTQKITVMAPTDMTPREAYKLFLVSLSSMGLTVVPHGRTLEIVEESRAKESPLPIVAASALPADAGMVRMLLRPRHIASTDLATVLTTVKSPNGAIVDVPGAGVVVVTDEQPVLARMLEVVGLVDVERRTRVLRLPLEHATTEEVTRTLQGALGENARVKLVPDARSNSILVIGAEDELASVTELVRMLDLPSRGSEPRAHVVRLEHADAEETSGVLAGVFSKSGVASNAVASATPAATTSARPARATPAPGASTSVASTTGDVKISFSKATNVIIVIASDDDFRSVREVVRELDVQRPQVYVEAMIMDVSVTKARALGLAVHGTGSTNGSVLYGGTNQSSANPSVITSTNATSLLTDGLAVALLGPTFDILGVTVPSLGAVFHAARSTTDVNVLSSPQLMATDHEEATLKVGENVPTLAQTASTGTLVSGGTSVQRIDVNLELEITPHIGSNGDVTLQIDLDIKELGEPDASGLGATWTTRAMHTVVTVKDQEPIVLGGLMSDKVSKSTTGVPILSDIPILGALFRSTTTERKKRNLMIVLVPYVVTDALDAHRLLQRKLREREEFQASLGNLDSAPYVPHVDYRKKRGLIAEIDHQVRAVDEDLGLREAPAPAAPPALEPAPATPSVGRE